VIGFFAAVKQLTRVPVPRAWIEQDERAGRSFAIVGAAIGATGGLVAWGLVEPLGMFLAVIPGVAVPLLLSGARPEDALSRWMEGGTLATGAVTLVMLFRVVAVASFAPHRWVAAFVLVHSLSRAGMLIPHILADPRKARIDMVSWLINGTVVLAAALVCGRWGVVASLFGLSAAMCVGLLGGRRAASADVLGASVVVTEIAAWTGLVIGWKV
jgi:cobalamin synthase